MAAGAGFSTSVRGVTFHNGKSLTSADIVANVQYHAGPDSVSAAKPLFAGLVSVRALTPFSSRNRSERTGCGFPLLDGRLSPWDCAVRWRGAT